MGAKARERTAHTAGRPDRRHAQVAQLVEHVTENHGVGGSIPPLGTIVACRHAAHEPPPRIITY